MTFQVRREIVNRLRDATVGLNVLLLGICEQYGIEALEFDLQPRSPQFIEGQIPIQDLEANSEMQYPCTLLYGVSATNNRRSKPNEFDGLIVMALECWLGEYAFADLTLLEHHTDAVEHAMVSSFNAIGNNAWAKTCDPDICYDGEIAFQRSPMQLTGNGQAWRRLLRAQLTFLVRQ